MSKAIVSLSGGMDSATLLALAVENENEVKTVFFNYGSKHNKYETCAAVRIASHYGLAPPLVINLETVFRFLKSDLLKTGGEIPEGHFEDESMKRTVVPGRNLIFISCLASLAESVGYDNIYVGPHKGDHAIYPDCRPSFVFMADHAVQMSTECKVRLRAPFIDKDKIGILQYGLPRSVPYHLTRTCYKDQTIACGKCGACQERLAAFAAVRVDDPLEYETR